MLESLHFGKLVVIGDVMLDCYVAGNVERISPEAPVPVVRQSRRSAVPGGAANVAINAAALGCSVTLIGAVGPDDIGMSLRNAISSHSHIDLSMLVEVPGWSTISKTRIISSGQQIVRVDAEYLIDFDDTIRRTLIARTIAALEGASVLVCSDYAKGVLSRDVVSAIIKEARARGIPVIVDPKIRDFTCYAGASLITPNRSEATLASGLTICGDADAEQAAALLSGQFGGDVLITRSEDGMTLWQRNGHVLHQPARKTEVFDVSGAGDTVLATIAAILSTGQDIETAVVIATHAASLAIRKIGTATVSCEELTHALNEDAAANGGVVSLERAKSIVAGWRRRGLSIVFTSGCFDIVHSGHIALLRAAATEGDRLIVALSSDASAFHHKGPTRPMQSKDARGLVVSALRDVDLVVFFDEGTLQQTIEALLPDVLVKGIDCSKDQVVVDDIMKAAGGRVVGVNLIEGYSVTQIVRKMQSEKLGNF